MALSPDKVGNFTEVSDCSAGSSPAHRVGGNDRDLAYIFSDVLVNSYEYWTTSQITKKPLKKSSKVILGDAIGAIHGSIFGPFGSIIEGALVSIVMNEGLPDDK